MKYCTGVKTFYYALVPQNCIHLKGRTILTHDFNNWSFWHYIWSKSSIINLSKKTSKYLTYRKSEQLRTFHPPSDPCNHLSFLSVCWWSAGHFCRTSKSPRIYSRNVLFLESPLTFLWISSEDHNARRQVVSSVDHRCLHSKLLLLLGCMFTESSVS